ncbi:MAG: UDP-2,4-diacetamido-2,4,6-trideoxy-beta-L-altropyranose hydrolase [Pseudomonadota bacterium]
MNVAIRVDASSQIGLGHFMRCLTLANVLKKQEASIRFISRHLPEHLQSALIKKGHEVVLLHADFSNVIHYQQAECGDLPHSHWLGTSQEQDVKDTVAALADVQADWLIVDHYALDAHWETNVRQAAKKILVIDDIADRMHACDVLLDQNYYADMHIRYASKVSQECQLLLGPSYALLREDFALFRKHVKPRLGKIENVLVFLGGIDAANFTSRALEALAPLKFLKVNVVIGLQHPYKSEIEDTCKKLGFGCYIQTDKMAELMASADLAIGAGGSASWERCSLGLPSCIVSLADNQTAIAQALDSIGAVIYLGMLDEVSPEMIQHAVCSLIEKPNRLSALSEISFALVDGLGANKVCQVLGEFKA